MAERLSKISQSYIIRIRGKTRILTDRVQPFTAVTQFTSNVNISKWHIPGILMLILCVGGGGKFYEVFSFSVHITVAYHI